MNTGTCKSCGKQILWIRTRTGRSMPCDTKPVNYRIKHGGDTKLVTPAGDVISCEAVAVDNVKSYLMDALADIPNREQITIIA